MPARRTPALEPLLLLVALIGSAALKVPPPTVSRHGISRRNLAATALGALPLLAGGRAAHAGFATNVEDISEERLATLAKNRQSFGDNQAWRIVCDRDDQDCLDKKRELAAPTFSFSAEDRKAAIEQQSRQCRGLCSRPDLMMQCDGRDLECLAERKRLFEESGGVDGKGFLPVVGIVLAAIVGRSATRPEKTENPKGMQIREAFYAKRKEDTELAEKLGMGEVSAFGQTALARKKKEMREEEEAEAKKKSEAE